MKSRNYESGNNDKSRNNDTRGNDAVIQASIEKSRYNDMSQNNDRKCADRGLSQLRNFTVLSFRSFGVPKNLITVDAA